MFATKVLNGPATDRVQVIRNAHICDALRTTKSTLLALMLLAPATLVVADDHAPWQGKCISATAEDIGSGFANRSFDLGENDWTLAFTLYADEAQSQAVCRIEFAGRYLVGGPSAYVADAQEAVFQYASRSVTPLSEGGSRDVCRGRLHHATGTADGRYPCRMRVRALGHRFGGRV